MPGNLFVKVVAPDRNVFRGEASRVRAPGVEGSFEVLHNHAPMLAALRIGPLFITTPSGDRIAYATSGGFLEVADNNVTVLAETAEPASDIDVERARNAEERALSVMHAGEDVDRSRAERALERARNRLRVAMGQVGTRH
ncbi:MAG TPA: F0F1 ATP synthase subunit epsilon [Rhodothermales bacterium]|nr:F0F1 ATP synthase subunit epsilon [Rhodothermales bacterium]